MYRLKLHKNLTVEKWKTFGRGKQLLMIANELNRAKNLVQRGDRDEVLMAFERAFELLDLTIDVTETNLVRYELLRFRELLAQSYLESGSHGLDKLIKVLVSLDKESYKALT
jgi:hypothetical protein